MTLPRSRSGIKPNRTRSFPRFPTKITWKYTENWKQQRPGGCAPGLGQFRICRCKLLGCRFHGLGLCHSPFGGAHLEAGEAAHGDIFAQLADLLSDQLLDADGLVLDEGLLQQADLLV